MLLTEIKIKNYRLLVSSTLRLDKNTTLIVGRNNTAKTSCMSFLSMVLNGQKLKYDDYPLIQRKKLFKLIECMLKTEISYEYFLSEIPLTEIVFYVDYSIEGVEDNLGSLSPFIIDIDDQTTTAIIKVKYDFKITEKDFFELFSECISDDDAGNKVIQIGKIRDILVASFENLFSLSIVAVNPTIEDDIQNKSLQELKDLFPFFSISAERSLDESVDYKTSSLKKVISSYFSVEKEKIDENISDSVLKLRKIVEDTNKSIQNESNKLLSDIIEKSIGFGYPNADELQLGVTTNLEINNQIQDNSELTYSKKGTDEFLPSNYNGLGYKNLIKIQFQLAQFSEMIKQCKLSSIPLLFIEEPESHMHPQMQQTFINFLESFLEKISNIHIQTIITSHSSHIANAIDFTKIRYAQKKEEKVTYKDLNRFDDANPGNADFVKKYLTLSKCDLFFADKAIFIEGASERLLIPDMIKKCDQKGYFTTKHKLTSQYYTLIEVGGAYAYKFIPFANFLGIPSLIITDIDTVKKENTKYKACIVSEGETTSNKTIKEWMKDYITLESGEKLSVSEIKELNNEKKTKGICHIEYQIEENGLCGRSLEEAIRNVNRGIYGLNTSVSEEDIRFNDKCKTDFALDLILKYEDYDIPKYIIDGLVWLNNQTANV